MDVLFDIAESTPAVYYNMKDDIFVDKCRELSLRGNAGEKIKIDVAHQFFKDFYTKADVSLIPSLTSTNCLEPFPYTAILVNGNAGTGKTTAMSNLLIDQGGVTSCASTQSASYNLGRDFESKTMTNGLPVCQTVISRNFIKYSLPTVQAVTHSISGNKEICRVYDIIKEYDCNAPLSVRRDVKCRVAQYYYKHLFPILQPCMSVIIDDFKKRPKFRLQPTAMSSPFYTDQWLDIEGMPNNPIVNETGNYVSDNNSYLEYLYQQYPTHNNLKIPQQLVNHTTIVDEAGRLPSYYNNVMIFIDYFCKVLYNSPLLYTTVPTIMLSGSVTQSKAIGYPYSMLDVMHMPAFSTTKNVTIFKSEYNRRVVQNQSDPIHHTMVMNSQDTYETSSDETLYTLSPFLFNEGHSEHLQRPEYKPNAIRALRMHKQVAKYDASLVKSGKAQIAVKDSIFISNRLVSITNDSNNSGETSSCSDEYLSTLSDSRAQQIRKRLWGKKYVEIFNQEGFESDSMKNNTLVSEKLIKSSKNPAGCGFVPELEKELQKYVKHAVRALHPKNDITPPSTSVAPTPVVSGSPSIEQSFTTEMQMAIDHGGIPKKMDRLNEKSKIRAIIGPAKDLLSRDEHRKHRASSDIVANSLGKGEQFCKKYYAVSQSTNQLPEFCYDPKLDLYVELKDRNNTTISSMMYLVASRTRHFIENSSVLNGTTHNTYGKFKGVCGTIKEIINNTSFKKTPTAFQLCVKAAILDSYKRTVYYKYALKDDSVSPAAADSYYKNYQCPSAPDNVPDRLKNFLQKYDNMVDKFRNTRHGDYAKMRQAMDQLHVDLMLFFEVIFDKTNKMHRDYPIIADIPDGDKRDLWVEQSPLYGTLESLRELTKSVNLREHFEGAYLEVIGDGNHLCSSVENTQLRNGQVSVDSRGLWSKAEELSIYKTLRLPELLQIYYKKFYPDEYIQSKLTIKVNQVLICQTNSYFDSSVNWAMCGFGSDTYLTTRFDIPHNSMESEYRLHLESQHFIAPSLINIPRPLKLNGCPAGVQSTLILKRVDGHVIFFDKKCKREVLSKVSEFENRKNTSQQPLFLKDGHPVYNFMKPQLIDKLIICQNMCPILPTSAHTIASLQGQSTSKILMCDLHDVNNDNILITLTRNRDAAQIHCVGVVPKIASLMNDGNPRRGTKRCPSRDIKDHNEWQEIKKSRRKQSNDLNHLFEYR